MRVEDLLFILRNDRKKFARAKELLVMSDEIQRARKAFDTDEYSKDVRRLMPSVVTHHSVFFFLFFFWLCFVCFL